MFFPQQRGIAADLPQTQESGEHFHATAAVFQVGTALTRLRFVLPVKFQLPVVHVAIQRLLLFAGQFGTDIALFPAQDEGGNDPGKFFAQLVIFGNIRIPGAECAERTEQTRMEKIENTPQVFRTVLQRSTGQYHLVIRRDLLADLGIDAAGVLDVLGFIQDQITEMERAQGFRIPFRQRVGAEADIRRHGIFPQFLPVRSGNGHDPQGRRKFPDLPLPVIHQTGRCHDEGREIFIRRARKEGNTLDRFSQPHFVRQDHIAAPFTHSFEPADAGKLILAQCAGEKAVLQKRGIRFFQRLCQCIQIHFDLEKFQRNRAGDVRTRIRPVNGGGSGDPQHVAARITEVVRQRRSDRLERCRQQPQLGRDLDEDTGDGGGCHEKFVLERGIGQIPPADRYSGSGQGDRQIKMIRRGCRHPGINLQVSGIAAKACKRRR